MAARSGCSMRIAAFVGIFILALFLTGLIVGPLGASLFGIQTPEDGRELWYAVSAVAGVGWGFFGLSFAAATVMWLFWAWPRIKKSTVYLSTTNDQIAVCIKF